MNDRLEPNPDLGRRKFLLTVAAGAGLAATSTVPLAAAEMKAPEPADKKRRARYQATSSEVQTFYRVNRYPAK